MELGAGEARSVDLVGVECVVFDLDGTLVESRPAIAASVNFTLTMLGRAPLTTAEVARHIGWGLDELLQRILGADQSPSLVSEAIGIYRGHYRATCVAATPTLPSVPEALAALAARGLRLGVATNKPSGFARQLLDGLDLGRHFAAVIGSDDVARPKPDPSMLALAIASLGSTPDRSLYVGDMEIDVKTAAAAGVGFIGVSTGNLDADGLGRAGATRVLKRLDELVDWLQDAEKLRSSRAESGSV